MDTGGIIESFSLSQHKSLSVGLTSFVFLVQKKLCTARSVVLVVDGVEIVVDDVFRNAVGRRRRRGVEVEGVVDVSSRRGY